MSGATWLASYPRSGNTWARFALMAATEPAETPTLKRLMRFGAAVLAEIASRSLSQAINDSGTAIDLISRYMRVLTVWDEHADEIDVQYPRLHVAPIRLEDVFDDLFIPLARDGAAILEVGIRLQKAFITLSGFRHPEFKRIAVQHSRSAIKRAEATSMIE